MIIGRDIMDKLGIDLKFSSNTIEWDSCSIPFTPRNETVFRPDQCPNTNPEHLFSAVEIHSHLPSAHFVSDNPAPVPAEPPNISATDALKITDLANPSVKSVDFIDAFSQQQMPFSAAIPVESPRMVYDLHSTPDDFRADIKESDYNTLNDGTGIAAMQDHLADDQKEQLTKVLNQFNDMFNQVLVTYPYEKVDLELKPNVKPIQCKPFSVPNKYRDLLKKEINKLVDLQVLKPVLVSQWAFPTFIIPKKDGTARLSVTFANLTKSLKISPMTFLLSKKSLIVVPVTIM